MQIISYNLRKNRAATELEDLACANKADVLCLQEANPETLPQRLGELRLVHATERNRLGLAMYVRDDRFEVRATQAYQLKSSLHDRLFSPADERLLGVRMHDHEKGEEIIAASFHASPLTALNSLRRHQIDAAHTSLKSLGPGLPSIMVGDFNYPIFQKFLHNKMRTNGFDMTISDKRTYTRYKVFRGHFDFATTYGLNVDSVRTLDRGTSDHLPILVQTGYIDSPLKRTLELV